MKTVTFDPLTHVLVPIEATQPMVQNAYKFFKDAAELPYSLYAAMLAAAPEFSEQTPTPSEGEKILRSMQAKLDCLMLKYCPDCAAPQPQGEQTIDAAYASFDELRGILKVPGYCCGMKHTEKEAFEIAVRQCATSQPQGEQCSSELRNSALEDAAKLVENGSFLHDKSPAKLFSVEVAKAIRAIKAAQPKEST